MGGLNSGMPPRTSDKETIDMMGLHKLGWNYKQIAEIFGYKYGSSVRDRISSLKRKRGLLEKRGGEGQRALNKLSLEVHDRLDYLRGKYGVGDGGRKINERLRSKIRKMYLEGDSYRGISKYFCSARDLPNISFCTVRNIIKCSE